MVTREHHVSLGLDQALDQHVSVVGGTDDHTAQAQGRHPPHTPRAIPTTRTWTLARTAPETLEP
jgi:hypothetical protein